MKVKRMVRSRYFVVIEETIIPKPNPRPASIRMYTGRSSRVQLGATFAPVKMKYRYTASISRSWMPSLTRLEITVAIGTTSLGK